MYLQNKYTKWYYAIIAKAQTRCNAQSYYERHHITPKSLGGQDISTNLVSLTAREHFVCHWLLTKMVSGEPKKKMAYALWRMANPGDREEKYQIGSNKYAILREQFIESRIGHKHSDETKRRISQALTGKSKSTSPWNKGLSGYSIHTDEYKEHLRQSLSITREERYGTERALEITNKLRQRMVGKTHDEIYGDKSQELKAKRSEKLKGKTLEEILGPERAAEGRRKRREAAERRKAQKQSK